MNIYALVMAGGKGTRFWPESTSKKPKQYLNLTGNKSLLGQTLERLEGLVSQDRRFIVTVKEQESVIRSLPGLAFAKNGLIFEPSGRNTAPCILLSLATLKAQNASDADIVVILPSDHVILNHQGLKDTIKEAAEEASRLSSIVTIGINPTFPHTGYGYIEKGPLIGKNICKLERFKEKPTFQVAQDYIASGKYLWNAGMFVAPIKVLLEEFQKHAPTMCAFFPKLTEALGNEKKLEEVYNKMPADSIDYAIMEKTSKALVIPARFDWNDLGSWDALESVIEKQNGNTIAAADGAYFFK